MCGIAGFLAKYGPDVAQRMSGRIAHRGPDDQGLFVDAEAGLALAHRRLAILDPSPAGHQPMASHSGRFVLCYNGEIYNFPGLRRELEAKGLRFRTDCDTEVILELFEEEGPSALGRLNGIFALAIWDREERTLTLARDGVGVKPLYLCRTPGGLAFASEIKAFLELPDFDREVDRLAAISYLAYLWTPGERTMFTQVTKLTPGQWLTIAPDGSESSGRFYDLPGPDPLIGVSEAHLIDGTRSRLRTAVHRQMLADVEVGAFLSGGLDSSAIVAFAREAAKDGRLPCFTIDYQEQPDEAGEMISDLPYAKRAAQHLGVDLQIVSADASMADHLERLVYHLDEPEADPAALNSLFIAELAHDQGIKVLLSGTGGDDLFSGYRRHQAVNMEAILDRTPRMVRQGLQHFTRRLPVGNTTTRRIRKLFERAGESTNSRLAGYFEWISPDAANDLLAQPIPGGPELARAPLMQVLENHGTQAPLERVLRLDQHFFLTDHNLNYADKTGMAAGVEIRVPFLDPDLVAWAARVPTEFKMRGGQTKYVLRKAMEGILPDDVIYRPKSGFGVPLRAWLRKGMRPLMEELLSVETVGERGLFNAEAVQRLKTDTLEGRIDASYALLGLMVIELWLRNFVDAKTAPLKRVG